MGILQGHLDYVRVLQFSLFYRERNSSPSTGITSNIIAALRKIIILDKDQQPLKLMKKSSF